jgi:hypothetical protein
MRYICLHNSNNTFYVEFQAAMDVDNSANFTLMQTNFLDTDAERATGITVKFKKGERYTLKNVYDFCVTNNLSLDVKKNGPGAGTITNILTETGFVISTTTPLTTIANSTAFTRPLATTGGSGTNTNWAITAGTLGTGITINALTGLITGTTSTTAGTRTFTVTVTDSYGNTASKAFTLVVS